MTYMRGRPSVWVLTGIILLAQGFFSRPAFAQGEPQLPPAQETLAQPQVLRNPEVNYPVHSDISPPLILMAPVVSPKQGSYLAPEVRYPKLQLLTNAAQRGLGPLADSALQMSSGPLVSTTPGLDLLGIGNGFPSYMVPDAPTDVNLAVGDTQVVQWVNVSYAVFNKTTGAVIAGPIAGNQFWAGFGKECETYNSGDIIAQWDKIAHRWVMTQNVFSAPYFTCVAISQTADATGSYYRFQFPQSGFPDYPKWGIWPDAYYQSQNNFGPTGSAYVGATACAYERAKMLVGDSTAHQVCFTTPPLDDSLLPGDLDSAGTLPPTGQPEVYLGSIDTTPPNGSVIYQYLFHVDFATTSNSTFTGTGGTMPINVASFGLACGGGNGGCIPQGGIADRLDALGDRLMYRLAYRNFSDHQAWLVSHSVTAGNSVGERWYEFHAPENSTSLSVFQQGTFAPDSNYRWMGSIAMDSAQNIALGYSISSPSMSPSISYTGRVPSDALGTMESEAQIVAGTGSQSFTANRWGDYTSMAIDGADDCTFWYTNQYYMVTAQFDWSTRLASFKFPSCGSTTPDFSLSASPSSQAVVQGNGATYTATVSAVNGFTGPVNLSASGLPAGATASFNPTAITTSGSSTMTVTTASSTPPGSSTITITGTNTSGAIVHTTTVVLVVSSSPDFTLSATPSSRTVIQGNGTTYTATVSAVNGFTGSVTFSASGLPSGASASFNPGSVTGSGSSTMTVTTSTSTSTGTYTITITGTSPGLTHTTTVSLTVNAAAQPNFSLSASPGSVTVTQGSSGTSTITVTPQNSFNGTVTFGTSGLPSGASASFSPTSVTGSGNSTMTVTTSASTPAGTYAITITGTSGSLSHSTTVSLTVNAAGQQNFSLSASPSSVTVTQGTSGTSTITVNRQNGFTGSVSLSASGQPSGVSATLNPSSTTSTSTLTLTASSGATTGTFTVTITGTSPGLSHTTTVNLTVNAAGQQNFSLSASPSSVSVARGSTGTSTIAINPTNGFTGSVTFSGSNLPTGVTAAFSPNPSTSRTTLTLTVSSSATTGTFSVRVRGRSGGLSHSVRISLTVR
jgi:hypothetical protein